MAKTKLKFSRGLEKELPIKYFDGEIRFCTDTGALFIDNATGRTKIAAGKADTADKLTTARVITLAGDVTGSVSFDGSKAVTITTTVKDDSHNHIIDNIDGLQNVLDAKAPIEFSTNYTNKKKWTAVTKVGSYSRLCQVTGYGNFLFSITLAQNSQVSIYTFAIGFGWESAEIHCIASTDFGANANQILRITRPSNSGSIYYIEILNNFSDDSTATKNCICTINELQSTELITNVVSYTEYTATDETHIEEASCETQHNGIVAPNFYGNATSSTTATTAATATKLSTSAGSTTQPVYFKDGKPVVTTYTLNKTVPADAKFTDTTYNNFVKSGSGSKAGLVPAPPTTAGTTKYLREDGTWAVPPNTTYSLASFGITASATELNYTKGVTSSIQTQLNNKLNLTGGSLTGAVSINRTAVNKTDPSDQDLVINYTLSSGDSLTEKNAPGIGFHISNTTWANFIYDGKFKFVNSDFTDYVSVQALSFIGNLIGTASTAIKATKLGDSTIGSTSQPIYLNAGTATKISAVGTAYGGTGATTVAGARTNLEVYSKTEVDNKLAEKSSTTHRHTVAHTPAGTISQPTFTGSEVDSGTPSETTSVYSITGVGSAPSLTTSVSNRCLVFSWKAGSVPTRSSVAVASSNHKHKVTASGTVSKPTFTGTAATLTTSTPI